MEGPAAPMTATEPRKAPRGGAADARRGEVRALARELFIRTATSPTFASKDIGHLAYDAIQKAQAFHDAADEHLK